MSQKCAEISQIIPNYAQKYTKYLKYQQGGEIIWIVPGKPTGCRQKCPKNLQKYYKIFSKNTPAQNVQLNQVGVEIICMVAENIAPRGYMDNGFGPLQ